MVMRAPGCAMFERRPPSQFIHLGRTPPLPGKNIRRLLCNPVQLHVATWLLACIYFRRWGECERRCPGRLPDRPREWNLEGR